MTTPTAPIACRLPTADAPRGCGCAPANGSRGDATAATPLPASRAAASAAAVAAAGALACGVCCVLPFALPAALLAVSGGILAWFAGAQPWVTLAAALAVMAALAWTVAQSWRTRRRPAVATLVMLAIASVLLGAAFAWPRLERPLIALLGG